MQFINSEKQAGAFAKMKALQLRWWIENPFVLFSFVLAIFPALVMFLFACYVCEARLWIGHWPQYGNPDPKILGMKWARSFIGVGMVSVPYTGTLAILFALIGRSMSRTFPVWTISIIAIVITSVAFIFYRTDPGGFLNWFVD
jgi:hypothetical protein